MGNTADLAMVQKTIIDTLHKESKSQRVITEGGGGGGAVQGVLYQSILNAKLTGRKKLGRRMCTINRDDRKLENTSSGKGLLSHFWNRNIVRSILPELRRKRTGLLLSGPKFSFQTKVHLAFHLEIKVWSLEKDWRDTESKLLEVQCEVSTVSDDLGCRDVCWCWSTVFYQVQSLPGDFGALNAIFLLTMILLCILWYYQHAWPEPHMEMMGYFQEKDEKQ